jgi:phosphate transport system permease protein
MISSASISSFPSRSEAGAGEARVEKAFSLVVWGTGLVALACVAAVFAVLAVGSWPALKGVGVASFFRGLDWHPTVGEVSLIPMVAGTFAVSLGALMLAGPVGVGCAIFLSFYGKGRTATAFRLLLQMLSGIPSVVYGLWGLTILVPLIAESHPPGASVLAGVVVLSIMILPTTAVVSEEAIRQLPADLYRGGIGLGIPRHRVIGKIVLPAARGVLFAAALLGLARALGETMAVLMVTGNAIELPTSLFAPVRTLSANIVLEMAYAVDVHRSALFVTGLVLMTIVLALFVAAARWERGGNHA